MNHMWSVSGLSAAPAQLLLPLLVQLQQQLGAGLSSPHPGCLFLLLRGEWRVSLGPRSAVPGRGTLGSCTAPAQSIRGTRGLLGRVGIPRLFKYKEIKIKLTTWKTTMPFQKHELQLLARLCMKCCVKIIRLEVKKKSLKLLCGAQRVTREKQNCKLLKDSVKSCKTVWERGRRRKCAIGNMQIVRYFSHSYGHRMQPSPAGDSPQVEAEVQPCTHALSTSYSPLPICYPALWVFPAFLLIHENCATK